VLALQHAVGNRAVARVLGRQPAAPTPTVARQGGPSVGAATASPAEATLESPRFSGSTRLQAAAQNEPPLREG